jgi:hypothetical protein
MLCVLYDLGVHEARLWDECPTITLVPLIYGDELLTHRSMIWSLLFTQFVL